jgi:hypothetical protein
MKSKICTTIDQCKKLLDLGIDINTADLTVTNYPLQDGSRFDFICCKLPNDTFPSITDGKSEKIPAWSLSALLGLMPFHIIENNNRFGFYQVKGFNKQGETYRFGYKTNNDSFLFETSWHNDIIDAAFEMVCWLKKEKYI